jgi:hypothetical protein
MSNVNERQNSNAVDDRRAESRAPAATLGQIRARLVGGSDLTLLNYTARSLYGQSTSRVLIGSRISVRLVTATVNAVVAGRVVRATLSEIVDGVPRYEVAVTLDTDVAWVPCAQNAEVGPQSSGLAAVDEVDLVDVVLQPHL